MHIHFVAVKVSVVRTRNQHIQPERLIGQHLHPVRHHRHLVERRLSVEQHNVPVNQMAIHHVPIVQDNLIRIHVLQRNHTPILAHNRLSTWPLVRPILNKRVEFGLVELSHTVRKGEIRGDLHRHSQFLNGDIGIGRNHRTSRKLHTLALDVVADAALLGADALLDGLQGSA